MTAPRSNWLASTLSAEALRRFPQSIAGQAIFAVGLSLMVNGGIGLPSWEILHQGLSYNLGITIGQAAQLSGLFVILLWIPIRQAPGLGTLSNIVVIGFVMDITLNTMRLLGVPPAELLSQDLPVALALTVVGTGLVGLGSGIYIGSGNGPGPRDGLMTGFHRVTGRPIWLVRTVSEVAVGLVGIALGGTFGFGTIWFAFTIGPQVQFWLARVDPTGRAKRQSLSSSRR
ncbi:MAG: YczE/YyaS/YitT family protein [Candidatus Limnocylindrus sp.]